MSDRHVSLEEAREAVRREVLAQVEGVVGKRNVRKGKITDSALPTPEKMAAHQEQSSEEAAHQGASEGAKRAKSVVVDVPFEAVRTSDAVRTIRTGEKLGDLALRCQRMMADGTVCGLPAYDGTDQCARHYRWYSLVPNYYGLPYPENATAVQEILARVAALVLRKQVEPRIGDTVARLCREMSRNLWAYQTELEAVRRDSIRANGPSGVQ